MINIPSSTDIKNYQNEQRARIAKAFAPTIGSSDDAGISKEDFAKAYPDSEFTFFSEKSVESFKQDFSKSEDSDPEVLKATLSDLTKVAVKDGDGMITFYVQKKEAE